MGGKTAAMRAQIEVQAAPQGPRWFVVQCHNQQERQARQNLKNAGFKVYLPMRLCPHPKARHPITPFFPRYLFVQFDPDITQWLEIISTVGVHDIIRKTSGEGRVPRSVPDAMIDRIKSWERDEVIHLMTPPVAAKAGPVFQKGDRVTIADGMFKGVDALVLIANDNDRVMVMLGLVEGRESGLKLTLQSGALRGAALRTPSRG